MTTAYLWDDDTSAAAEQGVTRVGFPLDHDFYRAASADVEAVVAYDSEWLLEALRRSGLRPKVVPGSWRRRVTLNPATFQDVIVSERAV